MVCSQTRFWIREAPPLCDKRRRLRCGAIADNIVDDAFELPKSFDVSDGEALADRAGPIDVFERYLFEFVA